MILPIDQARSARLVTGQHHEHLVADADEPSASDRGVGLVLAAASLVVGLAPLARGRHVRGWALAVAVTLLLAALVRPCWLRPLNRAWMAFGAAANAVVTWALMGFMFYGVITPMAWALRRLGRDPLRLRFEPQARSYWLDRQPPGPPPETMKNQF